MQAFKSSALGGILILSLMQFASAGDSGTVYTQVGLSGLGIGYAKSISEDWALRGQYNYLPKRSFTGDVGDFGSSALSQADIEWSSVALLADWYAGDGFHLSAGAVSSNNKITLDVINATVGTATGQSAHGEIKLSDSVAPYLGIGYLAKPKHASGFGFNFDLGVMFQNPKVTLVSTAPASDTAAQLAKVQDAIDKLKVFPVMGLGISYSF